jgi:hypothetical protein
MDAVEPNLAETIKAPTVTVSDRVNDELLHQNDVVARGTIVDRRPARDTTRQQIIILEYIN